MTIRGEGYTGTTAVRFANRRAKSFAVLDDTTLTAVSPATGGALPVIVTVAGGTAGVGLIYYRSFPIIDTVSTDHPR